MRQPDDAHEEERRHDRKGQEAELPVEDHQHRYDAAQENEVTEREDRRFQELLHGVHVALEPRHHAADLGLVHERQRDPLQMGIHRPAQVDEDALGDPSDDQFLADVGPVVDRDGRREGERRES